MFTLIYKFSAALQHRQFEIMLSLSCNNKNNNMIIENMIGNNKINNLKISKYMLSICGYWLIGLGVYFIILRPSLLHEDLQYIGTSLKVIQTSLPGLENWLNKVFIVMGGFIIGSGVMTLFITNIIIKKEIDGAAYIIFLSGLFTVCLMSAVNFELRSGFKWVLLCPALAWLIAFICYINRDKNI